MQRKNFDEIIEEQWSALISSSLDAIISTDSNFTVLSWNSGAKHIFAYDADEVCGKPFSALLSDKNGTNDSPAAAIFEGISNEVCSTIELSGVKKNGALFPVELTFSSWSRDGSLYYTFIIRDISQRKNVEKAWQKLNQELEKHVKDRTEELSRTNRELMQEIQFRKKAESEYRDAMQLLEHSSRLASIGVMAAGINHEINQPLTAIKFHVDGLLYWEKNNNGVVPEIVIDSLRDISDGIRRIDEIIKHMRSFRAEPKEEERIVYDLNDTIGKALSFLRQQFQSHSITLRLDLSKEPIFLRGIQVHMEQIIINLAVNSLHALDSIHRENKEIEISCGRNEHGIVMTFSDNGPGTDTDAGEKIFDPFYSTKKPGEGMGLGLAIVRHFVDEYDGTISVTNRLNGGAEFTITIPQPDFSDREDHENTACR